MGIFFHITPCDKNTEISVNFINNRYDISFKDKPVIKYRYEDVNYDFIFEVLFEGSAVRLGIWLVHLDASALKNICRYIFRKHKKVNYISFKRAFAPYGSWWEETHYRIELPKTEQELEKRLSQKGRYNLRREKRILEEKFGGVLVEKSDALAENSKVLWDFYFKFKHKTHNYNLNVPIEEYCRRGGITNIYSLYTKDKSRLLAVILSCEGCPIVFLENLTYDTEFSKFSPGKILYDEYLKMLIKSNKKDLFLSVGDYDYKKRYGSIAETVYSGSVEKIRLTQRIKEFLSNVYDKTFKK